MLEALRTLQKRLQQEKRRDFSRRVSLGDLVTDRKENAREMGFGEGTTCYDNVLILGDVRVGRNTWIGPNVVLDGSGGPLLIGDFCSISTGVQIYTHDTVEWSTSLGEKPPAKAATTIGHGVYVGPNTIVALGVEIGDKAVIGALSLVNRDIPAGARAWGTPARIVSTD